MEVSFEPAALWTALVSSECFRGHMVDRSKGSHEELGGEDEELGGDDAP